MNTLVSPIAATVLEIALGVGVAALGAASVRLRAATRASARRLEALASRIERLEASFVEPAAAPASSEHERLRGSPSRRIDRMPASPIAGPTLITIPDLSAHDLLEGATATSAELRERFGTVWELADAGASADAIARASGRPVGQIELILGLRRRIGTRAVPRASASQGGARRT